MLRVDTCRNDGWTRLTPGFGNEECETASRGVMAALGSGEPALAS